MNSHQTTSTSPVKTAMAVVLSLLLPTQFVSAKTVITQEIEAGVQGVDQSKPEAKFEEYGDVVDGVIIPSYKLQSVHNDKTEVNFQAANVRENDQAYSLGINNGYKTTMKLAYEESPHVYSNIARTLYNADSAGVFRLPDQIQTNFQNQQTNATTSLSTTTFNPQWASYNQAAHNVPLRILDQKISAAMGFRPSDHWKVNLGVSQDKIAGAKPFGAAFGFNNEIQMPLPVDWKVYNARAGTEWGTKKLQVGFNYLVSAFNNRVDTFIWDNPKRITDRYVSSNGYSAGDQSAQGRMPLSPDNVAHYLKFNAGVNLPARSRFTAEQTFGYLRQNERLVPYTINSMIHPITSVTGTNRPTFNTSLQQNLPVQEANTLMRTWMQNYAVSSRVVKPLTLGVRYRMYQLQNRSAEIDFPGHTVADQIWSGEDTPTHRFQYRKQNVDGTVDWDVHRMLGLGFKYGFEWVKRDHREIKESEESTAAANMDVRPARWMLIRGGVLTAHRQAKDLELEDYLSDDGTRLIEAPGLRRYDVANRLRNQGTALVQVTPGPFTFSVNGRLQHDEFRPGHGDLTGGFARGTQSGRTTEVNQAQLYGLLENRVAAGGVDLGWEASERIDVSVYAEFEQNRAVQRSNSTAVASGQQPETTQDPATDFSIQTIDRYQIAGGAVKVAVIPQKVDMKVGYDIVNSRGAAQFFSVGNSATIANLARTPPDTKYRTQTVTFRTDYRMTPRVTLGLGYLYQKYEVSDFALQGLPIVGGSAASQSSTFLGANLQNYVAHVATLVTKVKF